MLAWSSVAQAGYLLAGVVVGTELGVRATAFYLAVYLLMNVAAFAVVVARERVSEHGDDLRSFENLGTISPWLAWPMTIAMLSLAGFPATGGFIGKFYLIDASVAGDYTWLGIAIVIGSVISLAYYLRVIAVMWMGRYEVELPTIPPRRVRPVAGWSPEADARAQPEVRRGGGAVRGRHDRVGLWPDAAVRRGPRREQRAARPPLAPLPARRCASRHLTHARTGGRLRETAFDIIESRSRRERRRSGRAHPVPASSCRDSGHRPARARRPRVRRRHACPGRRQGSRDRRVRPARHLVRVRLRDHGARVRDRQGLGLSHQPRRDLRARGHQALPVARGARTTGARRSWAASSARSASGRCSPRPASTWASDRPRSTRTPTRWGSAIFAEFIGTAILMFAILGIVDARSPGDFAGIVIGGVVVAIIMVVGPITAASLNPARAIGPELVARPSPAATTHWNQIIPVYILPGLAGAALAAFAYDFLATPRKVKQPIESAVTHPDPVASPRGEVERTRHGYCRHTDEEAPQRSGEHRARSRSPGWPPHTATWSATTPRRRSWSAPTRRRARSR